MADNSTKSNPRKTPQDKHKHSVFTAAQNIEYKKYQNQMYAQGKTPMSKQKWYNKKKKN